MDTTPTKGITFSCRHDLLLRLDQAPGKRVTNLNAALREWLEKNHSNKKPVAAQEASNHNHLLD